MASSPKTIDAAKKAAATCKARALAAIVATPGRQTVGMPSAHKRWLRTLEIEGKIMWNAGWYPSPEGK